MSKGQEQKRFSHVPTVDPDRWHEHFVYRETFLAEFDRAETIETFRAFGQLQRDVESGFWPFRYVDATAHGLQAVLADLRFLQGYLADRAERTDEDRAADVADAGGGPEAARKHDELHRLRQRLSRKIGALADELEKEVGGWRFQQRSRPY